MANKNKKNLDTHEIEKFNLLAHKWWDPTSEFKPLHEINPLRLNFIKSSVNLNGKKVLDVGCGGGILSESLASAGADVTGIDQGDKVIQIAKLHANENNLKINYVCTSPEKMKIKNNFDVILNMEIVEHVSDVDFFLKKSSALLKKNGIMFVATLNKTLKSYLLAIVGAEYILRWLPIGTHSWENFVSPDYLIKILKKNNLKLETLDGMKFNLIKNEWSLSSDKSVNYIGKFIKN